MEEEAEFNISEDEEKEVLKSVKEFIDRNADMHGVDLEDFKTSKNIASGNGFSTTDKSNIWKRERARVSVNVLEPVINSIVFKFTEDPFDFDTEADIEKEELAFQLSTALREICIDGISYMLASVDESGKISFTRLNNFNVLYGDCKFASGKDCEEALYVDKEKTDFPRAYGVSSHLQTVLELKRDERPVMTYWKKTGRYEVTTYEIKEDKITNKVIQNISRIPVVRFYGKEVFVKYDKNWRGLYYLVKDLLRTMNWELSLIQERIATAPNELYLVAQETIGDNLNDWTNIGGIPKALRSYKALGKNGELLPAPIKNDFILNLEELINSFNAHLAQVNGIIGNEAGLSGGNETEEAVLLRKENKITAVSEMHRNLIDGAWQIANLIMDFSGLECSIENGIFVKSKKQQDLEKIMALIEAVKDPLMQAAMPLLAKKMDLSGDDRAELMALLAEAEKPNPELEQAKEQIDELNGQLEQANDEIKRLQAEIEARLASAQLDYQAKMNRELLLNERQMRELETKYYEIQLKYGVKQQDLSLDISKLQEQTDARVEQNNIEREKIIAKATENINS